MRSCAVAIVLTCISAATGGAQQLVTRQEAIARALGHWPRTLVARADSAIAWGELVRARQFGNPVLSLEYTKDTPQHHVALEMPLDFLWLRDPRMSAAHAAVDAAAIRLTLERQTIAYEADTTYTQAVAASARARLSRSNARDADSLVVLASIRRDAGDGSDLDVELAALNAGQAHASATADSLETVLALLSLRNIVGLAANELLAVEDTLAPAQAVALDTAAAGASLSVAAATADLHSAELAIDVERRQRYGLPSIVAGFDQHDPGGAGNQILPMIGVSLPLPLFNRNRGGLLVAEATRDRARAQLALARFESDLTIARARMSFAVAQERATHTRQLVDRANRVAALSLLGFREGATPLSSVLEAQRLVRENLTQYVNDAAAALNAASLLHLLERTVPVNANR